MEAVVSAVPARAGGGGSVRRWALATVLNWRWWVILPLTIACIPLIVLQGLAKLVRAGAEAVDEAVGWFGRTFHKPAFNWWRRSVKR